MMLVKTLLGSSDIHGIGLFADQDISQGTPVWRFQPGFDLSVKESDIAALSDPAREQFLKYSYLDPNTDEYVLCFDDARFFNHSDSPNCVQQISGSDGDDVYIAATHIHAGEELTCDYREFDRGAAHKLGITP